MTIGEENLTTVIILDDHPLLRKGVSTVIDCVDPDIEVVQSGTLKECIELLELYKPNLIIADLNLPDSEGIDSVKTLTSITDIPVLVYSLKPETLVGPACFKHGAKAYVMKEASATNLETAIATLLDGGTWCSPELAAALVSGVQDQGSSGVEKLSERELEVFEDLGRGQSIKEIAFRLELSPKTIESHRDRIKTKLNINNSNDLIIKARDWLTG